MDLFLTLATAVGTEEGFCYSTANIWQIVGYALLVFRIVIPLLLIILGMLDLGKAVIASKDDETKKATGSLVRRAIAAVIIFLLPTIISFAIGLIAGFGEAEAADYDVCKRCITSPNHEDCDKPAKIQWGID